MPPTTAQTLIPSLKPTPEPTIAPTNTPITMPTLEPTPVPTFSPTPIPTTRPTISEKKDVFVEAQGSRTTGQVCSKGFECRSNTCRNGVCMASGECYPIKHTYGSPFDVNRINIVFVASAFDKASRNKWRAQVNTTYGKFENYNMFTKDIEQLNVFLVDPDRLDTSFCKVGCHGVDRMLCCDIEKAHALSSKCFPVGSDLQTVVIHNSRKYGGAGYPNANIATVSTHPLAPLVAIHELGHSLFELADEYWYGPGSDADPNCDSDSNCDKWSDLVGNTPDGYEPVKCIAGCSNHKYYVGGKSFMEDLSRPVGAVNERFTCCTYQVLTKSMPSYCKVFEVSPNYLFNYCKNNDYQYFGYSNYEAEPRLAIPNNTAAVDDARHSKYVYVSDPVLVTISSRIRRKSGKTAFKSQQTRLPPGLFLRSQVDGDFYKAKAATKQGNDSLLKVFVTYATGKEVLLVSQNTKIELPLPKPTGNKIGHQQEHNEPRVVFEKSEFVEVVLDTRGQRIKGIRAKIIKTR